MRKPRPRPAGELLPPFYTDPESAAYWRDKEWKKWAVHLATGPESRPTSQAVVYVRARTKARAEACGLANSPLPGKVRARARLATWRELGCVRTTPTGEG